MIAVAGYHAAGRDGWSEVWAAAPDAYIKALHRAGALEAIMLPVELTEDAAISRLRRFAGLLLLGGPDVSPALYGEEAQLEVYGVDPIRDAFEIALTRAALRLEIPVLAICRGMQLVNVALGGTLHQHLDSSGASVEHRDARDRDYLPHTIRLQPGSAIAAAAGTERVEIASAHHQAVRDLGAGLTAVGWADDGLVEAVELPGSNLIAVQWHPEATAGEDPTQQALFDWLVATSRSPVPSTAGRA
jgi:putative glutamine amidotransferase